ncbi:probable serine/threonine-protein kinase DDB_G0282963 isoform X4 [Culex pipiens pallens]|uniref:probable serine/threonine-protein kinase DDB_G0282963 isoform X4 n=1 Tax=Culex pipiens pallens TaxID=42434 RepID=UPI001952BE51|nr:probable serine/threonine-protein kinase DDB_G0282963 isoform X4 [Culex pipiens pallens]
MTITFLPSEAVAAGTATAEHLHSVQRLLHVDLAGGNGTVAAFQAGGDGSDVDSNNIQDLLNDTDAPNDVLYMVCGVVIAMLLVGLIIVLVAVTISKLRKREESSVSPVTATNVEAATQPSHYHQNNNNSSSNNHHHNHHSSSNNHQQQHHQQLENGYSVPTPVAFRQSPSSVWVFPPLPPQPNLYSYNANSQDALVHNDKTGFKGLKRQLSGRFKRLVSRKSHEPAPAIPPELKPQLKTIYVY